MPHTQRNFHLQAAVPSSTALTHRRFRMKLVLLTGVAALSLLATTGARADSYWVGDRLVIDNTADYDAYAYDGVAPVVTEAPGVAVAPVAVERRIIAEPGYG